MTQAFVGDQTIVTFETAEVAKLPGFAQARTTRHQFLDLAGDGQQDCVVLERPNPGFYKRTEDQDWQNFLPLTSIPNVDWNDPNLRFVDLNGDGLADLLVTEDDISPGIRRSRTRLRHGAAHRQGAGRRGRPRESYSPTDANDLSRGHDRRRACPTSSVFATARSATGRTSAMASSAPRSPWTFALVRRAGSFRPAPRPSGRYRRIGNGRHHLSRRRRVQPHFNQAGNGWSDPQVCRPSRASKISPPCRRWTCWATARHASSGFRRCQVMRAATCAMST